MPEAKRADSLCLFEAGRYVRGRLSSWGRARRENRQGWKTKRDAYIRNDSKRNIDDNSKKEPKRD